MAPQEKVDYKSTINLPQTEFPMQGKLPQREPERLAKWKVIDLQGQILRRHANDPNYCLHDGPPYANGDIHIGHALNKILKDLIIRYKTMTGHYANYVPGWDCHGLPIEQKVLQQLGSKVRQMAPQDIRRECHQSALKWVGVQREQFQRLGIGGDWDNPYLTLDLAVEAGILGGLRDLVARDLVHKGFRPVYWDPVYQTALAEAEIEYQSHVSDSIYVKFPLLDSQNLPAAIHGFEPLSIVIWTTTPWTLPANLAVCLHPELEYVVLAMEDGQHYLVAQKLVENFVHACGLKGWRQVGSVSGRDLEHKHCEHPIFKGKESLVVLGEHVTLESGTGCVHTAPGHGVDDFLVGQHYGLPVFVPVDDAGRFTAEVPEWQGMNVFEANSKIVDKLRQDGLLLGHAKYEHQYPFSWRSHKPIIFRATRQWFLELDEGEVRQRALRAIDQEVTWIPAWGRDRIYNMVEQRPDWCLSRQRSWGVPIPAVRSKASGHSVLHLGLIDRFIEIVREQGTDAWFTEPLERFWPADFDYEGETRAEQFEKEFDILDVWFDSGATSLAVCERREGLKFPASLYLEGSDQHRGWFQSSLLIGVAARDRAPYEAVLTHGFVLDANGEAMSKSKGNVISPQEIVKDLGADGLRLWVISEDYRSDVRISRDILKRIAEAYRRIRNTFRFMLGNLYDFDFKRDAVRLDQLDESDRWILNLLNELIGRVKQAFENCEFHRIYHFVHTFCAVQLSALYLDMVKDRLYCSAPADETRRAAQTTCHYLADNLVRLIAPVLVFTADEVWEYGRFGDEASVHLADFPQSRSEWDAPEVEQKWERLLELRGDVARVLEDARRAKTIGHSLDALVHIDPLDTAEYEFFTKNLALLKYLFIVSQVRIRECSASDKNAQRRIEVEAAPGHKCERCWMIDPQVGEDESHPGLCPRCADVVKRIQ